MFLRNNINCKPWFALFSGEHEVLHAIQSRNYANGKNSSSQIWLSVAFYLVSSSALAMWPNMWAKELGIIPLSSGTALTPSIVYVLPVPVCPYAKIVPMNKLKWTNKDSCDWKHQQNKSVHREVVNQTKKWHIKITHLIYHCILLKRSQW